MCGIAGIVEGRDRPVDARLLEAMTNQLVHRGPDGEGYVLLAPGQHEKPLAVAGPLSQTMGRGEVPYRVGFGHRRLAVLDLSPLGHQPMGSEDGWQWITYNGEIYNAPELRRELSALGQRFRSHSDTEVLLAAYRQWGPSCLSRLNGMFAFALWDGREQALFCARDRFGIKPFYYRLEGGRLAFASEIKALLQDPACKRVPNDRAVFEYLTAARQDHTTETFFEGIHQLAPGDWMIVRPGWDGRDGQVAIEGGRWWHLPAGMARVGLAEAAARTRELLEDSVRLQLRADVPVGSCLSGGLDSSSIVCLMSRLLEGRATPRTFSSCHEDPRFDERPFIRAVQAQTGVANEAVFPRAGALFAALPGVIWHQEEPFAGTSILAQWSVMGAAGEAGLKVLLDGQGADELLCGYPGFMGSRLADLARGGRWMEGLQEWRAWRRMHGALPPTALAGLARGFLPAGAAARLRSRLLGDRRWLAAPFARRWQGEAQAFPEPPGLSLVERQMRRAVTEDLPALLHYEDRNAMAFSVETRLPFLDHRLVEWLAGLPPEAKLHRGVTKVVLREAMTGILPEDVRRRRDKMGFVTPEGQWLRRDLRPQIDALLASDPVRSRPYWRGEALPDLYRRYCEGSLPIGPAVWRWVNLEVWLRRFCD